MITITVIKKVDLPRSATGEDAIKYVLADLKGFFNGADLKIKPGKGRTFGSKSRPKLDKDVEVGSNINMSYNEKQTEGVV